MAGSHGAPRKALFAGAVFCCWLGSLFGLVLSSQAFSRDDRFAVTVFPCVTLIDLFDSQISMGFGALAMGLSQCSRSEFYTSAAFLLLWVAFCAQPYSTAGAADAVRSPYMMVVADQAAQCNIVVAVARSAARWMTSGDARSHDGRVSRMVVLLCGAAMTATATALKQRARTLQQPA